MAKITKAEDLRNAISIPPAAARIVRQASETLKKRRRAQPASDQYYFIRFMPPGIPGTPDIPGNWGIAIF